MHTRDHRPSVTKQYGDRLAVDDLSFDVAAGRVTNVVIGVHLLVDPVPGLRSRPLIGAVETVATGSCSAGAGRRDTR